MKSDDWSQLKALFHSALEQPEADRAAFLARACQEHPELEEPLRALIASHFEAADFLEQPAFAAASFGTDLEAPGAEPEPGLLGVGDVLDQTYEVDALLGNGGMGVVYRVRHKALARTFAAKLIHAQFADDPIFRDRFAREAEALGKLKHPHIVDVTDFGVDRGGTGRPYLVMEYLEGQTLQERLRAGPLASDSAVPVFDAIAAAIDHAHEQGVLHLDLKPGNVVLVERRDGLPIPKILDFGIAQFLAADAERPNHAPAVRPIGTPAYMAPELWDGSHPSPSADIYSLGVLMYEALTGQRPFAGSALEVREQQRHVAAPPASTINPAIGPEMTAALATVLARDPAARPATARAAVALVQRASLAAKQQMWRHTETPRRLGVAAVIAVVLTMLSALLWQSSAVRGIEGKTVDARFEFAAQRTPGPDIVLLVLDDASLGADSTPLPQRADQFGVDLQRVFDAGARAVALDFLLPEAWSNSAPFSQLVLRHADRLTLAALSTTSGEVIGPECITGVTTAALGPERASALFGFINLDQDDDGVSRRARLSYRDREGASRLSFAARAASTARSDRQAQGPAAGHEGFWIDHTIDAGQFDRVSWKDLDATLRTRPELFRNRLVLAGGTYSGSGDEARSPNHGVIAGVVLHAMTVDTIFSKFPVKAIGNTATIVASGVAVGLICAAILLVRNQNRAVLIVLLLGVAHVVGAFLCFSLWKVLLPISAPLLVCGLGAAFAWWIRRRLPPFPEE